jgi:hypothetical protein
MARERQRSSEGVDESQSLAVDEHRPGSDAAQAQASDRDLISRRAYARFEMRGREHGRDQDDWLEAERELDTAGPESSGRSDIDR